MKISYKDRKLQSLCESSRDADRKLGADSARKLRGRLADIDAAAHVDELPRLGNPHPLTRDRKGQFSIALSGGKRLVFQPDHEPVPAKQDGGIDWAQVTSVTIVYIGDYHD